MTLEIPVSELIVGFMQRLGVECLFGMPGAHILPVYDALYASRIRCVLAKHEQGAAFMAGGFARASGGVSACIATAGPGATNLVTGIANAWADRLPVLAITGETSTWIFGRGGLQESSGAGGSFDQIAVFQPITRYCRRIERTDYLSHALFQAAHALLGEPAGPVLLSLPFDVQKETADAAILDRLPRRPLAIPLAPDVSSLARRLLAAQNPVILAGYGCIRAGAKTELQRLAHRLCIPVATSLKAKGAIDETSPLALGTLGVTSSGRAYRYILDHADLLLILGASFNERTSYSWDARLWAGKTLIQIDHDAARLEQNFRADHAVQGDIRAVLAALNDCLDALETGKAEGAQFPPRIDPVHTAAGRDYGLFQSGFALIERFFRSLGERVPDACVFDDNVIFAQNFLHVGPGQAYYPNSGIFSLGHAIPAAIGARAAQARPTFALLGDGGFQMCGMELMTAVNHDLPINVVMFNNGSMGLIRKNQHQHYGRRFIACDFINPDYALLAQSFGIRHKRIENEADIDELFERFDLIHGINLIEIPIDRDLFPNYSSRR